ncbi:MAG: AMP-binding protein [Promethearchaeota archaeon]
MNDEIVEYWMKNWPKETPRHVDYEEMSLGEMVKRSANLYPDSQAIYFEGFRMTYKELDVMVDRFATALSRMGIKKGDVVLIDLPNVPQFVISYYGIVRIGAIANPIIPLNRFTEIVHQTNDSKGKVLIILDILYKEHLAGKDLSKIPTLEHIILTGIDEYLSKFKAFLGKALGKVPRMKNWPEQVGKIKVWAFQEFLKSGLPIEVPNVDIDPKKDISTLIYTGGTTGTPKGCMMSHYNFVVNCQQGFVWAETQLPEVRETKGKGGMFVILPLAHEFALSIAMNFGVFNGYKLILFPQPPKKLQKFLKVLMKEGATFGPGVPTLWQKINLDPKSKKYKGKLKSLIACLSGAAPLPLEVKQTFEELTSCTIVEGFGMSETSPLFCCTPFKKELYKANTVGFPVSDTLLKIVDPETGTKILPQCPNDNCDNCGAEESKYIGEICACGPQVFLGYLNRPKETEYALRKDSKGRTWYYTTDIGCIDKDGYLHIKDRKRDMIKYKGHSVFPREVEDLMYQHEAIREVGVIGVPDPEVGENIKAYVSLKPEYEGKITEKDLLEWCKQNISAYKYPRMIEIIPDLPKSVVGKILRRELRK